MINVHFIFVLKKVTWL